MAKRQHRVWQQDARAPEVFPSLHIQPVAQRWIPGLRCVVDVLLKLGGLGNEVGPAKAERDHLEPMGDERFVASPQKESDRFAGERDRHRVIRALGARDRRRLHFQRDREIPWVRCEQMVGRVQGVARRVRCASRGARERAVSEDDLLRDTGGHEPFAPIRLSRCGEQLAVFVPHGRIVRRVGTRASQQYNRVHGVALCEAFADACEHETPRRGRGGIG